MKIKRTANAGILLELDGKKILLDGVCDELSPYLGTPDDIRTELSANYPDVVAFTHMHPDHYVKRYADNYTKDTLRSCIGPECQSVNISAGIDLHAVDTRHIGKTEISHVSYVITGTKCVWFMGDASPLEIRKLEGYPKPDVLVVPYAFALTPSAWRMTKALGAEKIIILHMPKSESDPYDLWSAVEATTQGDAGVYIPDIGQTIILN